MTAAKTRPARPVGARPRVTTARQHPQGIVKAIVAVTGARDEVGDIIVAGIFGAALAKRRPKVVFHHDMTDFAGRIVHIEEWLPGDKRLPKTQPNGQPWPPEAGGLVATMQFNMNTTRGAEIYEWARFYAESGEAAWSIGYQVPAGMSAKRNGTRYIYGIDLFEVSLVLHGAHPMTSALEVKSAAAAVDRARATLEFKEAPLGALPPEQDHSDSVMVALYPDADTAKSLAVPGGELADDLHVTLAYLGKASKLGATPEDLVAAVQGALGGYGELSGQVGGLGMFPDSGDGTPVWAPVDVPGLEKVRESVVDAIDGHPKSSGAVARDHGYTPHMTLGYDLPSVSPAAPTPVRFGEVCVVYGNQRFPVPFGGAIATPGLPPIETKAAHRAVARARSLPPMEVKTMNRMPGSYEERQRLLSSALQKKFIKKTKDKDDDYAPGGICSYVDAEATFDDHVIATVHDKDGKDTTFSVPYTWQGDDITLGDPIEVELSVVPANAVENIPVPSAIERALAPMLGRISETAAALQVLPLEVKQVATMRPALLDLIDALYAKGIDVAGMALGDDEETSDLDEDLEPDDTDAVDPGLEPEDVDLDLDNLDAPIGSPTPSTPTEPAPTEPIEPATTADTAPAEQAPMAPVEVDEEADRVSVDPEEIRRELEEARA